MSLFVGIDVSSSDFKVRILDERGNETVKKLRVLNDKPGCEQIARYLSEVCAKENEDRLVIGLEATSVYSWPLQMFLAEDHCLAPLQPQIYSFNPKVIANFKKAYVDLQKNDWIDSLGHSRTFKLRPAPRGLSGRFPLLTVTAPHSLSLSSD